jgi:restriction system protein
VKRRITTDKESVEDVRNFVGAMVLAGADHGIFVTTATRFSKPAMAIQAKARQAKFKLELDLVDGGQVLEMLRTASAGKPAALPPRVEPDQEWRDTSGRSITARDLFMGDIREWATS